MYPPPLTCTGDAVDGVPVTQLDEVVTRRDEVVMTDDEADDTGRTAVSGATVGQASAASESSQDRRTALRSMTDPPPASPHRTRLLEAL